MKANELKMTKAECCRVRCPQRIHRDVVNTLPISAEDSERYNTIFVIISSFDIPASPRIKKC
jgi:hypothetical protein